MSLEEIRLDIKRVLKDGKAPNNLVIILSKSCLSLLGIWTSKNDNWFYKILNPVINIAQFSFIITMVFDVYYIKNNFVEFGENMCILSGIILIFVKMVYFQIKKEEFLKIYDKMHKREFIDKENAETKKLRTFNFLQEFILYFFTLGMAFLLFLALILMPIFLQVKVLPQKAWFPYDVLAFPNFELTYLYQVFVFGHVLFSIQSMDNFCGQMLNHTSLQFEILCQDIGKIQFNKNLPPIAAGEEMRKDLKVIIIRHQQLIDFVEELNDLLQPMLVAQVLISTMMICLTGFEATLVLHEFSLLFKFVTYMGAAFIQLLYWCWCGNKLMWMSWQVSDAAFEADWVLGCRNFRRDLAFLMFRSQKSIFLRAGPMYTLHYETFLSLLSGSYSFFNLLKTFQDKS